MNLISDAPFIRTTREFPPDLHQLSLEVSRSYIDIANNINNRTIGQYPTVRIAVTGNTYFLDNNQRFQSMRQVFQFGAIAAGTFLHIPYKFQGFTQFVSITGTCLTDFPDYRPLPYASTFANGNIDLLVNPTLQVIVISLGATSPNIVNGIVVLEWISSS